MVDSTVLLVVRILAGAGAMTMICSPSILMRHIHIHKQKHVGVASIIPLVMLFANCHVWMMYGYMSEFWFPIFTSYLFGDVASLFYITVYWRYSKERRYIANVFGFLLLFLVATTTYAIVGGLGYTEQTRSGFKSAVFINPHMVIVGLVNNWMWVAYGALTTNWIIIVPNSLFVLINSATLVLYMVFNPKTHPLPESFVADSNATDALIETEVELSTEIVIDLKATRTPSPAYKAMQSPSEMWHR
ncbi:hypothetical protein BBJ29_008430 [Phytophthora kernoviae]|uniref:MtN3-like protein n=1 Tax=Phytophthora kernoviae TaxID=325452 RepID=A0A3F2RJY1_9STRA|nr:hypothetical protein BBJ29_008430 [Phytophthora kernoviae]RLN58826.1 hypothetical protein BBP00_00006801 [Phytophthora kernoviae]